MSFKYKIGFIGLGNMARAIINGVIQSNILSSDQIIASHSDNSKNIAIENVHVTLDNEEVVNNCEILFLAIKPQVFATIGKDLLSNVKSRYIVSMMAGTSSAKIATYAPHDCHVIRIMPNTPCKIGKGVTAMQVVDIPNDDKQYIKSILASMGTVVDVEEDLFDAVVAVSGSGPAYAFMFLRALIDGGVKYGLSKDTAKDLAIGMLIGASNLAKTSDDLDGMIDAVCSKGGTTIEAVNYYKDNKLEEIVIGGMDRCYARSKELSR